MTLSFLTSINALTALTVLGWRHTGLKSGADFRSPIHYHTATGKQQTIN